MNEEPPGGRLCIPREGGMDNAITDSWGESLDDPPNEVTDSAGGECFIFR